MFTPRSSDRRASSLNFNSLCAIQILLRPWPRLGSGAGQLLLLRTLRGRRGNLREHIGLAQDQHLVGAELDLRAAVLGEDDLVALGDLHRDDLALVVAGAWADREDAAALRLLLGGVWKNDPADRRLLVLEDLDNQAIAQRL